MVTLEFQKFWEPQPAVRQPKECITSTGAQRTPTTQGVAFAAHLDTGDNVSQSQACNSGEQGTPRQENVDWACQPDRTPQLETPTECVDYASPDAQSFNDYPEDVALCAASHSDGTASVTGLEGPGSGRVFDVFGDDDNDDDGKENGEEEGIHRVLRPRKRPATSSADHSPKRRHRRHPVSARVQSQEEDIDHPKPIPLLDDLGVLQGAVTYIQRFYDMVKDGKGTVDSLGAESPVPHDLIVLQQAISKLQHAYGVIALRTAATGALAQNQSTARPPKSKRGKWPVEDDRRLLESRNHHGMPWGQIFELFPGRTPGAIQLRYYTMSRKENGAPSGKTCHRVHNSQSATQRNHPNRQVNARSTRRHRPSAVGDSLEDGCGSESANGASVFQGLENIDPQILDSEGQQ